MAFEHVWSALQHELRMGDTIPNWTQAKGLVGQPFVVLEVTPTAITVDPGRGAISQRVPERDFEYLDRSWSGYRSGRIGRGELRNGTRFSKYTISLLHWLEERHGGTLPG